MINIRQMNITGLLFLMSLFLFSGTSAQIYEPDGLRMPGDWNGWVNTQGMGGEFDLQKQHTGTPRWTTSFYYTGSTGNNGFKFVSTSFGDPWGNQWAGNTAVSLNTPGNFTYGTPVEQNNSIGLTTNKWYSVVFEDLGYADTRALFMETSAQPVGIGTVLQNPVLAGSTDVVEVSAALSGLPAAEEKFYLRYSTDDWATSMVVFMPPTGTTISANIPAQASQTTVSYYLFSTVVSNPAADYDLVSIHIANNNGSNYTYIVDQVFDCGDQLSLATTDPAFPLESSPVTVYFNAAFGNGGLFDYAGDVYAHTGVITNLSENSSDWKYVKTGWGENTPETMLIRMDENLYSLSVSDIRQYYGVPAAEQILKLAFVFRSGEEQAGGYYLEHKNADGSDVFVEVYPLALNVKILNPSRREPLVSPNTVLPVCVEAMQNDQVNLYLDNVLLTEETGSSISYPLLLQGLSSGSHWIKAVATGTTGLAKDSVQIYLRGPVVVEALPAGLKNGINYLDNNTVTLVLNDPAGLKNFAFAIGDYSDWLPSDQNYMKRTPDGQYYWVTLTGLQSGGEYAYQYFIDGNLKIADAYCDKILDPWNDRWIPAATYPALKAYPFDKTIGVVSVFQTNKPAYNWQVPDFTPVAVNATQSDLFIYELLVRDFVETRSLAEVQTKLDYLGGLGVNAVELMPVMEFDGNESWGYAPNFMFATDKFYGTQEAYKQLIDECHQRGMAVILDIVTNHAYGLSPLVQMYFDPLAGSSGQPSGSNPWLNPQATHPYSVGYDFNHESANTRQYFKDVFEYWITEYKVDGFRLDLSKGLTQTNSGDDLNAWSAYDQSRINILTDYYNHIKSVDPDTYVILEHLGVNSEETVLANTGMLLWSAMHNQYKQVGMGWQDNSDLSWAYHANRGFNYPNLVDYMENHDEERLMSENLTNGNPAVNYNLRDTLTAVGHMQMAAVLFLGIPGPKMSWQFGELGYDYSIMFGGDRTAIKPPRWDYFNQPDRQELYRVYAAMANLRKSDAYRMGAFTSDFGGLGKRMWIAHSSMNVVIAANMGVTAFDMAPGFPNAGNWYDYFSGEMVNITNPSGQSFNFGPGDFRVFTSVPLPRPYCYVNITVTDSISGAFVDAAVVTLEGSGRQVSDNSGIAGFTAAPATVLLNVTKAGYKPFNKVITVGGNLDLTAKMQAASNIGMDEQGEQGLVNIYPNPATDRIHISADKPYMISVVGADGRILLRSSMNSPTETMDVSGWAKGIYLFRLNDENSSHSARLVKY